MAAINRLNNHRQQIAKHKYGTSIFLIFIYLFIVTMKYQCEEKSSTIYRLTQWRRDGRRIAGRLGCTIPRGDTRLKKIKSRHQTEFGPAGR